MATNQATTREVEVKTQKISRRRFFELAAELTGIVVATSVQAASEPTPAASAAPRDPSPT
jgi:hypothetical protein